MKENSFKVGYTVLVMAAVVIILAGIKMAAVIVVPFLLAFFLAVILSPFYLWLKSKRVNEVFALVMIVSLLIAIITILFLLVGNSVEDFTNNVPAYEAKLRADLIALLEKLQSWGVGIPKEDILNLVNMQSVMQYIATTLKSLGSLVTQSFMIILTVVFMLMEISQFSRKLTQTNSNSLEKFIDISDSIKHYLLLKFFTSAATGMVITIGLKIFDVHYAVLWGLVAFMLNFIPTIGSIIAAVPAVLMAIVQYDISTSLGVALLYIIVNVSIGSILEPRIMGKGLGLSTLIVFLSLIFWGWLLGPIGMLLSVPLTIMIKIALDTQENTRWIAIMLGSGEGQAKRA
ncbi:AI-2E family transporter [Sulfurovum mangrovi]|uniref:AI-2E family transporter n=1 Tax=Sulfurovum mangrovi TaxID=2893889 RepID=UPI001E34875F|nr:AI-2E family transporter [Sulfurovum mangrovi]UFH60272.1 AI-2E family transporter [Sulfurovum mangrovi]